MYVRALSRISGISINDDHTFRDNEFAHALFLRTPRRTFDALLSRIIIVLYRGSAII